jgi:hypothetical protein
MLLKDLNIDLNPEYKKSIVESIQEGLTKYSVNYKEEFKTKTNNGKHFVIWDFINTEINNEMPEHRFEIIVSVRGIWQLILIQDKSTRCLYSIMKEKRFKQLQHRVKKDKVHYLDVLTSINSDLKKHSNAQITMFKLVCEERQEYIEKTLEDMLHKLKAEVERYVLISFSDKNNEITSVGAYIVTDTLDVVYQENWEEYVHIGYDSVIGSLEHKYDTEAEELEEIELPLKVRTNDNIVSLKETEKQSVDGIS